MKLVLDTNILISALLKDSTIRRILLNPLFEFYIPEFSIEEIEAHIDLIAERSNLSKEEVHLIMNMILANIYVVPSEQIINKYEEAKKIMRKIDEKDAPFLALALTIPNDGIWTEDRHFQRQNRVKIWKTKDLINLLREMNKFTK